MRLAEALAVASQYTDSKPKNKDIATHTVVVREGMLRATNGLTGCAIPVDGVDGIDLAVDCAQLSRMIKAIAEPTLTQVKGRAIEIKGGGVKYKLRAVPKKAEPKFPEVPKRGWSTIEPAQTAALAAISGVVDDKNPNQALTGLRLHPHWCAGASNDALAFAWVSGLVKEGFTVPPGVFDGLSGEADLVIKDPRLFIRDRATEQVRWSVGLEADWPDDSLSELIVRTRDGARSTVAVDLGDFGLLCRQAGVVARDRAEAFRLELNKARISITGAQGPADFFGAVEGSDYKPGADKELVGARPDRMTAICAVVKVAGGAAYLSVGGPMHPVLVWGGEAPVIEALAMPVHLPGEH